MGSRPFAIIRSIVAAAAFTSIFAWFLPRWFAQSKGVAFEAQPNAIAIALMIVGGFIALRCVWDFAWTGRGTPAPFDPPRRLVIRGFYRWVRNPMYVGFGIFLIGEALLVPNVRKEILLMTLAAWIAVSLFIVVYEEPTLRRLFGADYERYCEHVRRWIPRLTPFDTPGPPA